MENNPIPIQVEENSDDEYFKSLPVGYRFDPTDEELIIHYLKPKINNQELPCNKINIVKLYDFSPDDLAASGRYKLSNKNEWYFFTPRNKKYKGGSRPNRAAGDGYWKATEVDKKISHNAEIVGNRKTLVYLLGRHPKGIKTNWIMHEFTVKDPPTRVELTEDSMRLDDWVLCRLRKRRHIPPSNTETNEEANSTVEEVGEDEVENLSRTNLVTAVEEHPTNDEVMGQSIYPDWEPDPENEFPSTLSFNNEERFSIDETLSTPLNDQVGLINDPNDDSGVSSEILPLLQSPKDEDHNLENVFSTGCDSQYPMNHMSTLTSERTQHNGTHETLGVTSRSRHNIGDLTEHGSQYSMNQMPTLISEKTQHNGTHEILRMDNSSTHNIGGLTGCGSQYSMNQMPTSISERTQHNGTHEILRMDNSSTHNIGGLTGCGSQYLMNQMPASISERTQHNGTHEILRMDNSSTHNIGGLTGCGSQHWMNQMTMSISERTQHNETHETLRVDSSSTQNIGGCSQYQANPMPMVISRRRPHHETLEPLRVNSSSQHVNGGYPQYQLNIGQRHDEIHWTNEVSRRIANYMQMRIPNHRHDQIPRTLAADSSSRHNIGGSSQRTMSQQQMQILHNIGGSSQRTMNQQQIQISNHRHDDIHGTQRVNISSTQEIEGCFQPLMNQTLTPISNLTGRRILSSSVEPNDVSDSQNKRKCVKS